MREKAILIKDGEHLLLSNEEINQQNVLLLKRNTCSSTNQNAALMIDH